MAARGDEWRGGLVGSVTHASAQALAKGQVRGADGIGDELFDA